MTLIEWLQWTQQICKSFQRLIPKLGIPDSDECLKGNGNSN